MIMKSKFYSFLLLLLCTFVGHDAMAWNPVEISDGLKCYIFNTSTQCFVGRTNTMQDHGAVAYTAVANSDGTWSFTASSKYLSIEIEESDNSNPSSVEVSPLASKTDFTVGGDVNGYRFNAYKEWQYGGFIGIGKKTRKFYAYLNSKSGDGTVTLGYNETESAEGNTWILVSETEYNNAYARTDALERLSNAIAYADEAMAMEGMTAAGKTAIGASQTYAKTVKASATSSWSWVANAVSVETINSTAESLENTIAEYVAIADYYNACMEEIANAEKLGGAMSTAAATAKAAMSIATTTGAMDTAMDALHLAELTRLQTADAGNGFDDNTDMTGLIKNNSFDRGNMSGWYTLKINADIKDLSNIWNIIQGKGGDLSSLTDIISIGDFSENSHPIVNEKSDAMTNGHNRYYYYTHDDGQSVFAPIIGLPAGTYRASALMNSKTGLISGISCTVSVITIPTSIVSDLLGGIDFSDISSVISGDASGILGKVMGNIGEVIGKAQIKYESSTASKSNQFVDISVDFAIEETSIAFIVLNASSAGPVPLPLVGNGWFKADNVRLTQIKSKKRAEKELESAIKNANIPEANIASKANNDNPFTYNTKLVDQYKSKLETANSVAEAEGKTTDEIAKAGKDLADFEETFFDKAFQGPTTAGRFNLTIKDSGANCTDKAVTFTEANGAYNMQFTDVAGATNFHQVVAFEKAGDAVNTYVVSITDKDNNKVYLSGNSTLSTTADKESATIYSVVPSYTVETVSTISNDGKNLGVGRNSDKFAGVSGNNTYSSLAVTPAANHEVALNVSSVGWGTFILPYSASVPTGFKAYKATGVDADNVVTLQEVSKFDACVPYIVAAEGGNKTTLSGIALATENLYTDELLTGAFTLTDVPAGEGNYLLQNQESKGLGFYRVADDGLKIGANRAYLTYNAAQSVKLLIPSEDATAIETIDSEAGEGVIYDLSGRRVNNAVKGVYIINGKKVIK